jgi:hypothetical protein
VWSILSLVVSFFGKILTWIRVCLAFSRHSFGYHASMFPFTCGSRGRRLFISSSYDTYISFIISPLFYNTMYLFWLGTSYGFPFFMALVWSYHWQSRYPFALVPLWEWTYDNPWYVLDIIVTIALENGIHVQREVSHLFPRHTWRWVDIFRMLMDIIMGDLICIDME